MDKSCLSLILCINKYTHEKKGFCFVTTFFLIIKLFFPSSSSSLLCVKIHNVFSSSGSIKIYSCGRINSSALFASRFFLLFEDDDDDDKLSFEHHTRDNQRRPLDRSSSKREQPRSFVVVLRFLSSSRSSRTWFWLF